MIRIVLGCLGLALLALAPAAPAAAQAFPQRAVKLVVPFAAGGNADIIGRLLANALSEPLGQQVVVENKTGGGSTIACEYVAHAPADGHTLLLNSVAHVVNAALFDKLAFDPVKDFAPIVLVNHVPNLLVVNPKLGPKDLASFLKLLRDQPGKHTYGSGGNGAAEHLSSELLRNVAKVDIIHVPYRGGAPALNDLVAGQISFMLTPISGAIGHVRSGNLVGLAVSTRDRVPALPDLPSISEQVPGYDAYSWNVLFAPAGTPKPVIDQLNQVVNRAIATPAVSGRLRELGNAPVADSTPESVAAFLVAETNKWQPIVRAAGTKAD